MKTKISFFDITVYTLITLFTLITIYPFVNVLTVSLSDYTEYIKNPLMIFPKKINFDAYIIVFTKPLLISSYSNTLFITFFTVVLSILLMLITAYPLSRPELKGKVVFMNLIIFTMLFNGGLIPNFLLIRALGLYNSLWALILPSLFGAFNVILLKNFIEALPSSLIEAAKLDGASHYNILFKIVFPLSMPIIATLILFIAVSQWNSFFTAIVYISDNTKWTLQLFLREMIMESTITKIYDAAQEKAVMPETIKYAALMVVMLPIMCTYPFVQKYFVKGIMVGAVKG
jgi:putative aldouronate transport system permease protein